MVKVDGTKRQGFLKTEQKKSRISQLNPFIDVSDVIHVGERLQNSYISDH